MFRKWKKKTHTHTKRKEKRKRKKKAKSKIFNLNVNFRHLLMESIELSISESNKEMHNCNKYDVFGSLVNV